MILKWILKILVLKKACSLFHWEDLGVHLFHTLQASLHTNTKLGVLWRSYFFWSMPPGKPSLLKWSEVAQLCLTLCNPMDCSLPGFSIQGIFQARVLEWVAISLSRGSSQPRDWTRVSHTVDRYFTIWVTREVSCIYTTKDTCIHTTKSLCCIHETITTLLIDYIPI